MDSVLVIMDAIQIKNMPPFYEEAMKELKPNCIKFCLEHFQEIDFEKIRAKKMNRSIAPDILMAIQSESK